MTYLLYLTYADVTPRVSTSARSFAQSLTRLQSTPSSGLFFWEGVLALSGRAQNRRLSLILSYLAKNFVLGWS